MTAETKRLSEPRARSSNQPSSPTSARRATAIRFLGGFEAMLDGQPLAGFESDKVRALLTFLAVEREVIHSRDELAGLLCWPPELLAPLLDRLASDGELRRGRYRRDIGRFHGAARQRGNIPCHAQHAEAVAAIRRQVNVYYGVWQFQVVNEFAAHRCAVRKFDDAIRFLTKPQFVQREKDYWSSGMASEEAISCLWGGG